MVTRQRILFAALLLGLVSAIGVSAARFTSACRAHDLAHARLKRVHHDARAIITLRRQSERVSIEARPTEDVLALINTALAEAGLPQRHLADLRSESDAALPSGGGSEGAPGGDGPQYRRQSLSVSLRELSPADLGAFISAWRQVQTVWSVTRLTLAHPHGRGESSDQYDVNLIITAVYVEE